MAVASNLTNRIRSIYGTNMSFTSTGRISMHEPNLQTVAKDIDLEFLGETRKLLAPN